MTQATFTFRVDSELKEAFADAAKMGDRTGAQLLRGFMRNYVRDQQEQTKSYDTWFYEQVQAGLQEAGAGLLIPDAEVEADAAAWRAKAQEKLEAGNVRKP